MKAKLKISPLILAVCASLGALGDDNPVPVLSRSFPADTQSVGKTVAMDSSTALTFSDVWIASGVKSRITATIGGSDALDLDVMEEREGEGVTYWIYGEDMTDKSGTLTCEILDSGDKVVKTLDASFSLGEATLPRVASCFKADTESLGDVIAIDNNTPLSYGSIWFGSGVSSEISAQLESTEETWEVMPARSGENAAKWFYSDSQPRGSGNPYTLSQVIRDSGNNTVKTLTARVSLEAPEYSQDNGLFQADTSVLGTTFTLLPDSMLTYSTEWKHGDSASIIASCEEQGIAPCIIHTTASAGEEGQVAWDYSQQQDLPRSVTYTLTHYTYKEDAPIDSSLKATVNILPEPGIIALIGLAALFRLRRNEPPCGVPCRK